MDTKTALEMASVSLQDFNIKAKDILGADSGVLVCRIPVEALTRAAKALAAINTALDEGEGK